MVVFVDFESEDDDPYSLVSSTKASGSLHVIRGMSQAGVPDQASREHADSPSDHRLASNGGLFASVLACYPASQSVAAQLDLNDLYSLALTCRKIHESISQFARQLRTQSLHCTNEVPPRTSEEEADSIIFREAIEGTWGPGILSSNGPAYPVPYSSDASQLHVSLNSALGLSGKVGKCARDMVAACRKCGIVVCRNCAVKPPSDRCLPNRHRRLCRTCLDAPLTDHLNNLDDNHDYHDTPPASSASSARSVRTNSSSSSHSDQEDIDNIGKKLAFTSSVFLRQPCHCASRGVFLCQPCGQSLISADTTYKRVWTWRSRYSTHIGGGLGTGLGLGNQGQKCGRGEYCLERGAVGVCWVEIECSEARPQIHGREDGFGISRSGTPLAGDHEGEHVTRNRPGYLSQELEGIGGVLKNKVKKRVKVGAPVYEYDDERASGKYLEREANEKQRSWCGWCSRVCPGEKDQVEVNRLLNQHA